MYISMDLIEIHIRSFIFFRALIEVWDALVDYGCLGSENQILKAIDIIILKGVDDVQFLLSFFLSNRVTIEKQGSACIDLLLLNRIGRLNLLFAWFFNLLKYLSEMIILFWLV